MRKASKGWCPITESKQWRATKDRLGKWDSALRVGGKFSIIVSRFFTKEKRKVMIVNNAPKSTNSWDEDMNEFKNSLRCHPTRPTMNRTIVFSLLLNLIFVWPVWGAVYYMRADGKAANKAASTSCSSPSTAMSVATHNAQTFSGDDIIYLCSDGGDFKTAIVAPSSGTSGHPITYTNAPSETPVIDLSHTYEAATWTDHGGGVYSTSYPANFLTEDDIPMVNCDDRTVAYNTDLRTAICNWFYDSSNAVIYYKPTSGTPASHTIRTIWYNGLDIRNLSNITVFGLTFKYCWYGINIGQDQSNPASPSVQNVIIRDNTFFRNNWCIRGDVIVTGTVSDHEIYNNTISYSNSGISQWSLGGALVTGFKIHHNTITHHFSYGLDDSTIWNGYRVSYWFTDHEGISFQEVQDSQVYNNVVSMSFSNSVTLNNPDYYTRAYYIFINPAAVKVSGNVFARNYASGIFTQSFYISGHGDNGIENNVFAYNVIKNRNSDGTLGGTAFSINIVSPGAPAGATNYWVNNSVYGRSYNLFPAPYCAGSWTFANNIAYMTSGDYVVIDSRFCLSSQTFRNNIYYGSAGFMLGDYGKTWAEWKALGTLYDSTGSILGSDPLFTDGSGTYSLASDFNLQSTSPAKWAGVYIAGLTTDYAGNPVYNPPSIGAYEYGTTPPKIPTGVRVFPK
jgi:hypothetical protein